MSVDDHGLETLKKAAEQITPGDPSEYRYRVNVTHSALPDGAATEATLAAFKSENDSNLDLANASLDSIETKLDTANATLTSIDGHVDQLEGFVDQLEGFTDDIENRLGATSESAAGTDTATSGLNGLIKRINQHLTTLESYVDGLETQVGATNETAPATDTAASGLNGRLQRVAQRLTDLIAYYNSNFGATTGAIRVAAIPGNVSGIADFNAGATGAQTQRVSANILRDGNALEYGFGSPDGGSFRVAAVPGNATGIADFNAGATGAQTLRVAANLYDSNGTAITSRSYASARPIDTYITNFGSSTVTITTLTPTANVSTQALASNAARKWVKFINNSGANFFLSYGATATVNNGVEIPSNGGSFTMSMTELYTGNIYAIVASNARTLEIWEAT